MLLLSDVYEYDFTESLKVLLNLQSSTKYITCIPIILPLYMYTFLSQFLYFKPLFNQIKTHRDVDLFHKSDLTKRSAAHVKKKVSEG